MRIDNFIVVFILGFILSSQLAAEEIKELNREQQIAEKLAQTADADEIIDLTVEFITGAPVAESVDRKLATVPFTDIVGSTRKPNELGDDGRRELLTAQDEIVRRELVPPKAMETKIDENDKPILIFDRF